VDRVRFEYHKWRAHILAPESRGAKEKDLAERDPWGFQSFF
jgi:hypothetical protein